MNIHPVFVHFPIALLTIYALLELARFRFFMNRPYWFHLKAAFLLFGLAGALAARQTGELALELFKLTPGSTIATIAERHELFANLTSLVFGILGLAYLIALLEREGWLPGIRAKFPAVARAAVTFTDSLFAPLLAALGLIAVTVTGALGGMMVYGPDIDPVVSLVYRLLIQN